MLKTLSSRKLFVETPDGLQKAKLTRGYHEREEAECGEWDTPLLATGTTISTALLIGPCQ